MVVETAEKMILEDNSTPFVWCFRFGKTVSQEEITPPLSPTPLPKNAPCDGWEVRFFWPFDEALAITTPVLEPHMFDVRQYVFTIHRDLYIVSDKTHNNLKIRNNEVLLKKLVNARGNNVEGFLEKDRERVSIEQNLTELRREDIDDLFDQIDIASQDDFPDYSLHYVVKESMLIHLKGLPAKVEFSKLYIDDQVYLSLCIESRSFEITDHLRSSMNFITPSQSYVTFLRSFKK